MQADPNLRWAHVSEGSFSDVAAQIKRCRILLLLLIIIIIIIMIMIKKICLFLT